MKAFNRWRFTLILTILVVIAALIFVPSGSLLHAHAAVGSEPTWALPFPMGPSINIGPLGLHDHNFGSMKDDRTGKVFTFTNKLARDSLDMVLQPPKTGTSTIPTTSFASGTVLAVWAACQLVLIDHGNGWWAIYLHMANIKVTSSNIVKTGSIIGYPTTIPPTLKACGSVESTAEHVHFAFLNGSGTAGSYVPILGKVLCGHKVVELNNDPTNIILQGLTQTKDQVFTVPACSPTGHFQFSPSSVSVMTASGQNPSPQTLTMTNGGNGTLTWSLTSTLPSWLAVDSTSGSLAPGTSAAITLTFSLPMIPGTYSTTLVFSAPNANNSPAMVPVNARVIGWGIVSSPNDGTGSNRLYGVAVVSASDIWTVGNGTNGPLIEHYDGTSWSIISGPSNGVLTTVAATSASDVWAMGFYGNPDQTLIEHYDGTSWSVVPSPSPGARLNELDGVAAISASNIWAVGYYIGSDGLEQNLIEHYDGTSWSVVPSPNSGTGINQLHGVAAVSGSDIWSVGDFTASYGGVPRPLIEHYDGTNWSVVPNPTVGMGTDPYELLSLAAVSASDVWTVGTNFNFSSISPAPTLIEHWDGTSWTIIPSPTAGTGGYLQVVAATSANNVWAVGFYGTGGVDQTLIEHWDGTNWSIVPSPNVGTGNNTLLGVAAVSASNVWAVGSYRNTSGVDQTLIEHYS